MSAARKHPDVLRERAVRLVLDAEVEPGGGGRNLWRRFGEQFGISPETLRGWVKQAEIGAGVAAGTGTDVSARLAGWERENRELRRG